MEIQIIENAGESTQVIIKCRKLTGNISRLKSHIEMFDSKLRAVGKNEICYVSLSDILYFESVDNRTFLYTENAVMEIKYRLYELESLLPERDFIRASKSQIVNISKLKSLKPELNRTLSATMCNGEQLHISRKYVPSLKKLLSI